MVIDEEKAETNAHSAEHDVQVAEVQGLRRGAGNSLLSSFRNVEARGIQPIPINERTNKRTYTIFTLWFTMSLNPLPCV